MSAAATPNNPPSTGFTTVEKILHEFRDRGRSPSLDKLQARVGVAVAEAGPAAPAARMGKEPQFVTNAMAAAAELIHTMRREAAENTT